MDNIQKRDVQVGVEMGWHKKTVVVDKIDSSNCQILYPMMLRPLFYTNDGINWIEGNGRQIMSTDDGLPIGAVVGKKDYKLFSNIEIWDCIMEGLAGTKHPIVSCGSVADRSLGFVSIKVSENFIAANRNTKSVLNVLWGHGGNKAVSMRSGFTVVVCENTFNIALRSASLATIRHTANANLKKLSEAIDGHIGVAAEFKLAMDRLDSVDVSVDKARKVYAGFISADVPETKTGISRTRNTVESLVNLFLYGKGNSGHTMADLFNGVTDYYSHESSGGRENSWKQFVSSEFGSGNNAKDRFLNVLESESELKRVTRHGENVLLAIGG